MTNLQGHWKTAPLGDLVDVLDYARVPISAVERAERPGGVPYYGASGQVGWIDKPLFDEPLLLLGEDGVQFFDPLKSKAYLISGPAWVNNHAHVLRARESVDRRYLFYYLNQFDYHGYANGTTRLKLTQAAMKRIPVILPERGEQRRIVDILEDRLSRLDAARCEIQKSVTRLSSMRKSILMELIPEPAKYMASWRRATVAKAGKVELGRQRHPDWHAGPNMRPYLRVANVFEDRLDLRDVKEMHWPDGSFERFRLQAGDVLLNEGQSPELVGRPAMYRGEPAEIAFTNSLIRFQAYPDVLPEFALLVFRRHMHAGRFRREARITTNIAHLSATRLKSIEFPIPPLDEQRHLVSLARERIGNVSRIGQQIGAIAARGAMLRRALLDAAFSGRLSGPTGDIDMVGEMAGV